MMFFSAVCARLLPSPVSCKIQCCRKLNVQLLLTKGTNLYKIYPQIIEFYTSSCVYLFLLPSTRRLFCLIHKFMKSMFIKFRHSLFEYV